MNQAKFLCLLVPALALVMTGCKRPEKVVVETPYTVSTGEVSIKIIETGTIDAVRSVEIKPQVTGKISKLFVDEGSKVTEGQLIAVIDPKETQLRVDQGRAQLMGARSQVTRADIEISQRRKTVQAALDQAKIKVAQLEIEIKNQPTILEQDVTQAKANLESAKNDFARLKTSVHPTQRSASLANLAEADANLKNALLEVERQRELEKKGYVALKSVQAAEQNVAVAKARMANTKEAYEKLEAGLMNELERAQEAINTAQSQLNRTTTNRFQLKTRQQDLKNAKVDVSRAMAALSDPALLEQGKIQSQATVMQLSSALEDQERQLGETQVKSPINGIVTKRVLQVGELATGLSQFGAGSIIVKIEDRTQMRVKLAINEIDVARLNLGQMAEVTVDAIAGKTFVGKVSKIAPARQEVAGVVNGTDSVVKYEVEILLQNNDNALKSGMSARCTMNLSKRDKVAFLPIEYIEKTGNDYFAAKAPKNPKDPKSTKEKIKLKVGVVSSSRVEILGGLNVGDQVVKPDFNGPKRKGFMQMGPDDDSGGNEPKKDDKGGK